jgi:hypothetical protein
MVCTGFSRDAAVVLEGLAARDKNGFTSGAEGSRKPIVSGPTPAWPDTIEEKMELFVCAA